MPTYDSFLMSKIAELQQTILRLEYEVQEKDLRIVQLTRGLTETPPRVPVATEQRKKNKNPSRKLSDYLRDGEVVLIRQKRKQTNPWEATYNKREDALYYKGVRYPSLNSIGVAFMLANPVGDTQGRERTYDGWTMADVRRDGCLIRLAEVPKNEYTTQNFLPVQK